MSLEIITGKTGEPHIDSEDIGAYNAYTIGKDSYLLNGLDMTITNVNTLHVGTGEVLFQGRHVRIKGNGEDVAIANGTTGYKRNDILCLKYQKFPQNSDIESISLELVKGTPTTGTPADPAITTGSILNGDTVVYLKLARIVVNGLTPEAPVKLLGTVKTLAETNTSLAATAQTVAQIGASIDQQGKLLWSGSFNSGTINVPNIMKYKLLAFAFSNKDDNDWTSLPFLNTASVTNESSTVWPVYEGLLTDYVIEIVSNFKINTNETITWGNVIGTMLSTTTTQYKSTISGMRVIKIYGIM